MQGTTKEPMILEVIIGTVNRLRSGQHNELQLMTLVPHPEERKIGKLLPFPRLARPLRDC